MAFCGKIRTLCVFFSGSEKTLVKYGQKVKSAHISMNLREKLTICAELLSHCTDETIAVLEMVSNWLLI